MSQNVLHIGGTPTLQEVTDKGAITDKEIEVKSVKLTEQVADPAYLAGRMFFDGVDFRLYDNIPGTSLNVCKELVLDVRNGEAGTLLNLQAVRYTSPVVGGVPSVVLALADTVQNAQNVAIMTHDVIPGEVGKAVTHGTLGGDTSAWAVGDRLFLSATVPGGLTNVEQPILKPIGRVLVSDAVDGKILVSQQNIVNVTAIGQASGLNQVDSINATPSQITAYDGNIFEKNTAIILTGGVAPFSATIAPASIGATGFYQVTFSCSITSTTNARHTFEMYINGVPTGVKGVVDLSNAAIDFGSTTFLAITQQVLDDTDLVEVYGYTDGGTSTVTFESTILGITRIGNV